MYAPDNRFISPLAVAPRAEIEHHQVARLRALLVALLDRNPFYGVRLREAGISEIGDMSSLVALRDLPFTTKQELIEDQQAAPPFGTNLTYPLERYIRIHQTSGTMGQPLRWLDTPESWEWWGRCWQQVFRAAGVGAGDRVFFPFSFGPFVGFWAGWEGAQQLGALAISGASLSTVDRLALIQELQATVLVTTPTYAAHMAEVARREGLDLPASPVRTIIVAGEPGGSLISTRLRIEQEWGARLYDHAGSTEIGAFGFTCEQQAGMHVNEAEFIAEVMVPGEDRPAEEGELVLTNLGRLGSPLLRYRTGDLVRLTREPCACGSTFARLEGGILGRADDMMIVRGINLFPSSVEEIVWQQSEAGEFMIELSQRDEIDAMRLLVELDENVADRVCLAIARAISSRFLLTVPVIPVAPGSLPRWEIKARRVRDLRE